MAHQGLGILGLRDPYTTPFDPLMFLAEVSMQDALPDALMEDEEMQEEEANTHPSAGFSESAAATSLQPSSSSARGNGNDGDTAKGNLSGRGKGKGKAKAKPTAKDKLKQTAKSARNLRNMRAAEETKFMKEMKEEALADRLATEKKAGGIILNESTAIAAAGIAPNDATLLSPTEDEDADLEEIRLEGAKRRRLHQSEGSQVTVVRQKLDFFGELSRSPELLMELAKYLRIKDFVSLYAISKDFHDTIDGHLTHILKTYAAHNAPESSHIFVFGLYRPLCKFDPAGRADRLNPKFPRMVPSLKWLRMIMHREKCVREILACMAREGHRMPKTMSVTLKKMWLTMDISTSARRVQLMHNDRYWTDNDLFNAQMFFIKLDMRFNDPIDGPGDDGLRKLMLGQRGLTPLCQLLKRTRYTDVFEIFEAAVRYSYWPLPGHQNLPVFGVPPCEIGKGHLEGWGMGHVHLYRADELVMRESCRRYMQLSKHLIEMMIWGYVDKTTGENIQVTEEEMYMSDDDDTKKKG